MFKRANKLTALLVAAASVMSMVPVMAADATRLGTEEGTINSAVAFKDGKYVYEGYKTNSDNKSVYYNAGDKDKELTDIPDASIDGSYADKYAAATDGSDQYLVDLTNGSVIDNDTRSDRQDTASTKLKSNVKKTDRYGEDVVVDSSDLTELSGLRGGDTWYQYGATTATSDASDYLTNSKLYGYTDDNGKYIDTSYVANVYAYSSAKDKVVKIDNFSNKDNDPDTDTKLQATLLDKPQYLAQDKDNIYQLVNVRVTDTNATTTTTDKASTFTVNFPTSTSDVAFQGATSTATIDWSKLGASFVTTGTATTVVIGGATFTYKDAPTATEVAAGTHFKDLATLKTAVNTYFNSDAGKATIPTYTYSDGVFTAKAINPIAANIFGADTLNPDFVKYTAGKAASFTVNGVPFTYDITVTDAQIAAGVQKYRDIATLKTAVNNYFTKTANAVANYYYNNGTFTNTAAAGAGTIADIPGNVTFVAGTAAGTTTAHKTIDVKYIQKISKAQGDNKDGGLLPKSVASYELSKNYYDCGDGDDAYDAATTTDGPVTYQVTNGTLFAIRTKADNVKVVTMKLMKDKVKFDASQKPSQHANIDDKVDVYMVEKGDDNDTDVDQAGLSSSVDVNGNIWAIHEGSIKEFVSGKFVEKFTCDRSMDKLDVYDENNLVAWDASGDVYTTNKEGTAKTASESTAVAPVVVTGWVQGTDGSWTFNDVTGAKVVAKWINYQGAWYFLKADGIMATGWYNDNGTWYFLKSSGAMATGWYNDNGTWYYLNASGAMLANTTVDGYVLGASGAWIQ